MIRIEMEFVPMLTGFLAGAGIFLIQRLLTWHSSRVSAVAVKDKQEEEGPCEPTPEPGPEPVPSESSHEEPGSGTSRAPSAFALPLVMLFVLVAAGLSWGLWCAVGGHNHGGAGKLQGREAAVAARSQPVSAGSLPELAAGGPVTLNLTRQEMAVEEVDGAIQYKSAYWSRIKVGTPAMEFKVVFDTGSGHLVLPSTYCTSDTCRAHKRYRRKKSSSARDINYDGELVEKGDPRDQITVNFGTGEVMGVFVEERACLAEQDLPATLATNRPEQPNGCMPLRMIVATHMSEEPFRTFHFDGILGLGLSGLSQAPEFNFMHVIRPTLSQWGSHTPQMFSVFLADRSHEQSEITLGGYLPNRLESKIVWNPVVHPELGHWMLDIESISVDGEAVSFCKQGCRAVMDTGTSLLAVPTPAFPEIYELLRHQADPLLGCRGRGPKLRIKLQHFTVELGPRDYARAQSSLPGAPEARQRLPSLPPGFKRNESVAPVPEVCKPMLMTMDLPEPVGPKLFILGEPVLRKYYTVYDTSESEPQIGFAPARHVAVSDEDLSAELAHDGADGGL